MIATCQPISSSSSLSGGVNDWTPVSANVGCAVPWNASQTACLIRSRFASPAFGHA